MRTATIDLNQFGGVSPRTEPRLLRETMASAALDVDLLHGDLRPRRVPYPVGVEFEPGIQTIYRHCSDWLGYPGKVYLANSLGADKRLYIVGDGTARVRTCGGDEFALGITAPAGALTDDVIEADLTDYNFSFYGWYEGVDGQVYARQSITPTQLAKGKNYTFVPFAQPAAPPALVFCVSIEVERNGDLLGVAYSENSYRAGLSDLYLQGQKAVVYLRDQSSGTNTVYDGDPLPSLFAIRIFYEATDASYSSRSYVYTYVRRWPDGTEDESAPSPATDVIAVDAAQAVTLSNFVDPNRADVNFIRIYRTDSAGTFRFVADIPVGQTTYTDKLLDTELGEVLPSASWEEPPDDLAGLVNMPNGFMIGFAGNTLYPSAQNQEHAFPSEFTKVLQGEEIVGIAGAFENSLVVVTKCHPYIVTAYTPDSLTVTKVNAVQPCVSALSLVDMGRYGVGYVSMHGFVLVRAGDAPVMSEAFYTPDQWLVLKPETMRCSWHTETLHVVSDVAHLVWDMSEGEDILTQSQYLPTAMWGSCEQQVLWVILAGQLQQWERGAPGRLVWRSKETSYTRPVDFVRAIVESEGSVTLRLFADGVLVYEYTVDDDEPFALPVLPRSKYWYFEIDSGVEVDRVTITNQHTRL